MNVGDICTREVVMTDKASSLQQAASLMRERHVGYLARNPVKKHLAASPTEYLWSSASAKFRCDDIPQGLKPLNAVAPVGTAEAVP